MAGTCELHGDEKCRNEQEHKDLWDEINCLKRQMEEQGKQQAVSGEQIKMIFRILNEIKGSIKDIADKMDARIQEDNKDAKDKNKMSLGAILQGAVQVGTLLLLAGIAAYKG